MENTINLTKSFLYNFGAEIIKSFDFFYGNDKSNLSNMFSTTGDLMSFFENDNIFNEDSLFTLLGRNLKELDERTYYSRLDNYNEQTNDKFKEEIKNFNELTDTEYRRCSFYFSLENYLKNNIIRDNFNDDFSSTKILNYTYINFMKYSHKTKSDFKLKNELISIYESIINCLNEFIIDLMKMYYDEFILKIKNDIKPGMNQIFLSYAYVDHGLTLCLFFYFLRNNAFLYCDWMWNKKINNIKKLKNSLNSELNKSVQLLFLRSINSEFNTSNKYYIREWCAWEIGNFYCKNSNEKFYTSFYNNKPKSVLLKTFRPLNHVTNGKMY